MKASKELKALFIELIQLELSNYELISKTILANTIQYYSSLEGFNQFSYEYWFNLASKAIN